MLQIVYKIDRQIYFLIYSTHSKAFIAGIWCTYTLYQQDIWNLCQEDEERQEIGLARTCLTYGRLTLNIKLLLTM